MIGKDSNIPTGIDKIVGSRGERKPPVSTVGIANPLV